MTLPKLPFRVEIELLNLCNLESECIGCYSKPFNGFVPTFEEISYIIKKTKIEAKPFELVLLGGEPFLRKDIVNILQLCKEGFNGNLGISTNGTTLDKLKPKDVEILREISTPPIIQVSIDSADPKINNLLRGKTEKVIRGINFLNDNAIPFTIGIVASRINIKSLESTIKYFSKLEYLDAINLEELQPAKCMPLDIYNKIHLTSKEMVAATSLAKDVVASIGRKDIIIHGFSENEMEDASVFYNNKFIEKDNIIQVTRAGVFANGDVTPGAIVRDIVIGNLHRENWPDIWAKGIKLYEKAKLENNQRLIVTK